MSQEPSNEDLEPEPESQPKAPEWVDLTKIRFSDIKDHEGDPVLEATLKRLLDEVENPGSRITTAGFSSGI